MTNSDDAFATGRCLCGAVRVTAKVAPAATGQCHCKDCQRTSGGGHASVAIFNRVDLVIEGETKSFTTVGDRGNSYTRHFCPSCGSRLHAEHGNHAGHLHICVGIFDDNSWYRPDRVLYTSSQPPWDITTNEVPRFAKMPEKAKRQS